MFRLIDNHCKTHLLSHTISVEKIISAWGGGRRGEEVPENEKEGGRNDRKKGKEEAEMENIEMGEEGS